MKSALIVVVTFALFAVVSANAGAANKVGLRVANATDVCLANCSSEKASCQRVCPTTFNVPCLNACDSQEQFCKQNCQRR
jgi:hypothetical protein